MWKQTCYELHKWLYQPFMPALLLLTFLVHGALCYAALYLPNDSGYSCVQETQIWDRLTSDTTEGQMEEMELLRAELQKVDFFGMRQEDFSNWYARYLLVDSLLLELQGDLSYPDFLAGVAAQAELLQSSSLLSAASSYSARETAQLAADYLALNAEILPAEASNGVEALTQWFVTDLFLILWGMVLVLSLFVSEKQDSQFILLRATPRGGGVSCFSKWLAMALSFLLLFLLYYGSRLLIIQYTVGLGSFDRPIQSIAIYYKCTLPLSVGEFLCLFFVAKLGALWVLLALFAGMASVFPSIAGTVLGGSTIVGVESVLYFQIDRHAWNGLWKELNLFAMTDTEHYFTAGIYVNGNGTPISVGWVVLLFGFLFFFLGASLSGLFWKRTQGTSLHLSLPRWPGQRIRVHPSLIWQEGHKLFRLNHALLLFLLLCGALVLCNQGTTPGGEIELYYQSYSQILSGPLSEEKRAFLDQESQRFQDVEMQIEAYQDQYTAGNLSEGVLAYYLDLLKIPDTQLAAFEQAVNQYEMLEQLQTLGETVEYIYETGWSRLFGVSGQQQDQINYLLLSIFLILVVGTSRCSEFSTGMCVLRSTMLNGRQSALIHLMLCVLLGGVASLIAFLFHIGLLTIPLPGWNSIEFSVQSITVLGARIGLNTSIFGYMIQQALCRMAGGALAAALIWCIATVLKRIETTFLLSGIFLLGQGVMCLLELWNAGLLITMITGAALL